MSNATRFDKAPGSTPFTTSSGPATFWPEFLSKEVEEGRGRAGWFPRHGVVAEPFDVDGGQAAVFIVVVVIALVVVSEVVVDVQVGVGFVFGHH